MIITGDVEQMVLEKYVRYYFDGDKREVEAFVRLIIDLGLHIRIFKVLIE